MGKELGNGKDGNTKVGALDFGDWGREGGRRDGKIERRVW